MERRLIISPRPWRQLPMALTMVVTTVVGVSVWMVNAAPDKNLGFGAALGLVWAIYLVEAVRVKLIVTADAVRLIAIRRGPSISRERIYNIRALRWDTVFYDHDNKPILRARADLSRSQLLALGEELRVNVWDHRAWHGLRERQHGVRLNQEPGLRCGPALGRAAVAGPQDELGAVGGAVARVGEAGS